MLIGAPVGLFSSASTAFSAAGIDFATATDYADRSSTLTGASDGSQGALSLWFRIDGEDGVANRRLFWTNGGTVSLSLENDNKIWFQVYDAAFSKYLSFSTTGTYTSGPSWINILISWDANYSAGNKKLDVYINDSIAAISKTDASAAFSVDYTGNPTQLPYKFYGCLAEAYVNYSTYIDLSVESNRRLFISATGHPVDIGADGSTPTGTSPIIYLSIRSGDTVSAWATNRGSGGNFVVHGTPSLSSTNP